MDVAPLPSSSRNRARETTTNQQWPNNEKKKSADRFPGTELERSGRMRCGDRERSELQQGDLRILEAGCNRNCCVRICNSARGSEYQITKTPPILSSAGWSWVLPVLYRQRQPTWQGEVNGNLASASRGLGQIVSDAFWHPRAEVLFGPFLLLGHFAEDHATRAHRARFKVVWKAQTMCMSSLKFCQ